MGVNLERGLGLPEVPLFQTADYSAGVIAMIGILLALMRREQTGEGGSSTAPCSTACSRWRISPLRRAWPTRRDLAVSRSWNPMAATRYNHYATKDGKAVAVSLLEAKLWREFCEIVGRQDLVDGTKAPRTGTRPTAIRAKSTRSADGILLGTYPSRNRRRIDGNRRAESARS